MTDTPHHGGTLADARRFYDEMVAADLARNPYPLERVTVRVWRARQALWGVRGPRAALLRKVARVAELAWIAIAVNSELPPQVCPGPGIRLHHGGRSIVLHPSTRIGANVDLFHGVTVGVKDDRPAGTIGDDCGIGAGACILGPVTLGAGTNVGANAVVVSDTEPGSTYAGVPARRLDRRG